jgi:guanylate kinase
MILLRLSGHSCAGKTRLVEALPKYGMTIPKVLRYTSRPSRPGELHGQDYYFMSRSFIRNLPEEDFLIGPVRNMLQAFDLNQIEIDLKRNDLVLIEIYPALWPRLLDRLTERLDEKLVTASVFMTAVDPGALSAIEDKRTSTQYISAEVKKMLTDRGKDEEKDIEIRAQHAAHEILEAISPQGKEMYDLIIHSAPEGPDGEDDWTREEMPVGQARVALEQFVGFCQGLKYPY